MRNGLAARMVVLFLFVAGGCASDENTRKNLASGYQALEAREYDKALAAADHELSRSNSGPGSAEALYLRGRVFEQRIAGSPHDATTNLQSARAAYAEALTNSPSPKLETYIRTSLANVAYFQDDYASALREWSDVYEQLDDAAVKSWVLYRMGLCHQRLGNFEQADRSFAQVQQSYPNTLPAQRAREHEGARGFTVQFATYVHRATADGAMNALRADGLLPKATTDAQGRTVVRVGPYPSYRQAFSLKQKYADRYPDALVVP